MDLRRSATKKLPAPLDMLPKWRNLYEDFITKNASAVSQIESGLRSFTYIIPGRYRESELASESLHSGVQLLSLYHDSLLARAIGRLRTSQRPHPSPHNRYTTFWTSKSPTYHRLATLLQMIQYTELLWEMAAKRKGERVRWHVVALLEIIKACCRVLLLRLTNSRPLLSPPLPEREVDPSKLDEVQNPPSESLAYGEEGDNEPSGRPTNFSNSFDDAHWTMPRTGLSLPSLPDSSDISGYLLSKVLTPDDVKPAKALLHRVTGKGELAEIMYILRPVIYSIAMARWNSTDNHEGKNKWAPWLLGFGIEFGARQLAKRDFAERFAGGLRGLTALEREELRRRGWGMAWWVMRGAFYENITRPWIQSFTNKLRGKPLLDLAATVVDDYDFLWDQYYFPTATL